MIAGFAPYPGFDPCDGDDPHCLMSLDNPCRCHAADAPVDALRSDHPSEASNVND